MYAVAASQGPVLSHSGNQATRTIPPPTINPQLSDTDRLASHCSRYRFAQPVCGVHFQQSLPPLQPFPGVFTADTTAYYPEDRGISESIDFGRKLARQAVELLR